MTVSFTADEALALAEKIERHGAAFYRHAAAIVRDPTTREQLLKLADWEGTHEELFAGLRRGLGAQQRAPLAPDPEDDTMLYLSAMAARHVLNRTPEAAAMLRGDESTLEVLEVAIGFERDSIALFQGLEAYVPEALGRDRIRRLIAEEIGHVAFLVREQDRVTAG